MSRKILSLALALSMGAGGLACAQTQTDGQSNSMGNKAPIASHTDNAHHWESSSKTMGHDQHYMATTSSHGTDNTARGMTSVHSDTTGQRTAMSNEKSGMTMSHEKYSAGGSLANGSRPGISNDGGKTSPVMPASQ